MPQQKKRKNRDHTKSVTQAAFVRTLRRIADAVESGDRRRIQVGGERISVPRDAVCSIEHERDHGQEEIELQLSWERKNEASSGGCRRA